MYRFNGRHRIQTSSQSMLRPCSLRAISTFKQHARVPRLFSSRLSASNIDDLQAIAARQVESLRVSVRTFAISAFRLVSTGDEPPTVSFNLTSDDGMGTKVHVQPSYPHKPKAVENLLRQLPPLLTAAGMPIRAIKSFSTTGWDLDESGNTIHRYVRIQDQGHLPQVLENIKTASRGLNHDPHIHIDGIKLTISCTTHVPPGLSMKDVKLAKRIDEVLADVAVGEVEEAESDEADILTQRQRGREHNMEAIRKAKLDCSCG